MRKSITLIIILILFIAPNVQATNLNFIDVCIKQHCFTSRLADNPRSRTQGLMNQLSLPKDEGMIFIFPFEMKPEFWMKNMYFPLDILFINDDDIIVYIIKNVPPCKSDTCPNYKTTRNASKVLEINAGLCNEYDIHVGDKVIYFIEE